jgi:hypothetical protein
MRLRGSASMPVKYPPHNVDERLRMRAPSRSFVFAVLLPLLAAGLAWGWAELRYLRVVPQKSNLVAFIVLVVTAGIGVGYYARWSGRNPRAVAFLALFGTMLAGCLSCLAMLYVAAQHGDLG